MERGTAIVHSVFKAFEDVHMHHKLIDTNQMNRTGIITIAIAIAIAITAMTINIAIAVTTTTELPSIFEVVALRIWHQCRDISSEGGIVRLGRTWILKLRCSGNCLNARSPF